MFRIDDALDEFSKAGFVVRSFSIFEDKSTADVQMDVVTDAGWEILAPVRYVGLLENPVLALVMPETGTPIVLDKQVLSPFPFRYIPIPRHDDPDVPEKQLAREIAERHGCRIVQ